MQHLSREIVLAYLPGKPVCLSVSVLVIMKPKCMTRDRAKIGFHEFIQIRHVSCCCACNPELIVSLVEHYIKYARLMRMSVFALSYYSM